MRCINGLFALISARYVLLCLSSVMSFVVSLPLLANEPRIMVKGLFSGRAVLEVNGASHLLKDGKATPEGVKLLRATSKFALVEYQGKKQKLFLNRQVGTTYDESAPSEVYIPRGQNGHFETSGRINNRWVMFMIDTGASNITMNNFFAEQLGVSYEGAPKVTLETAQGHTPAYRVVLDSVAVGDVQLSQVEAFVIEGRFPQTILLGNTFLSRVNFEVSNAAMTIQAKY